MNFSTTGGDIYDHDSPIDMDVSDYFQLNLSTDSETTCFKEATSHDEWK